LRAHKFFSSARLSKFGQGLCSVRRPYVGLSTPTLDGFCDGHKDFLQLYRLLTTFSTVDHVKNAQSCVNRVNALCGTYGGTYENRISFATGLHTHAIEDFNNRNTNRQMLFDELNPSAKVSF
jgi:hypothetical protein